MINIFEMEVNFELGNEYKINLQKHFYFINDKHLVYNREK